MRGGLGVIVMFAKSEFDGGEVCILLCAGGAFPVDMEAFTADGAGDVR